MSIKLPSSEDFLRSRFTDPPTTLALSSVTARTAAMTQGLYIVCANIDWNFRQGDSSVTATTSSFPMGALEKVYVWISGDSDDSYVAGICETAGTAFLQKVV